MYVKPTFDTTLVERLIARVELALFESGWQERAEEEFADLEPRGMHAREGFFAARRMALLERRILVRRQAREEARLHRLDHTPLTPEEKLDYVASRTQILVRMHQHLRRRSVIEQDLGHPEAHIALVALAANLREELRVVYKVSV